jgi:septal ring factor EnvC (AmiA/AmiB activator)
MTRSCTRDRRTAGRDHLVLALLIAWLLPLTAIDAVAESAAPVGDETDPLVLRERDLAATEAQRAAVTEAMAAREHHRELLYRELERQERDIGSLTRSGRQLTAMIAEQTGVLRDVRARYATARIALEETRSNLAGLIRSAYQMGRGDRLRMLLDQEDLVRGGRLLGYYQSLGRARSRRLAELDRRTSELDALSKRTAAEVDRMQRLADRQAATLERLEQARAERAATVAELDRMISDDRARIAALDADSAELRKLIEILQRDAEIREELAHQPEAILDRKGRLAWPVDRPRLLSGFRGYATPTDSHGDGVLLAAPAGTEVRAVHHGRVAYADWLRGFGLLIVIDHDDDYLSLYGHNQTLLVEVGDWVDSGDVIALSGASGGRDSDALYFAMRHGTRALDPGTWCSRRN